MDDNYSINALKKAAFVDELNVLKVSFPNLKEIIEYLEKRIKELDERMKKQ
jgi:hypothetical protein